MLTAFSFSFTYWKKILKSLDKVRKRILLKNYNTMWGYPIKIQEENKMSEQTRLTLLEELEQQLFKANLQNRRMIQEYQLQEKLEEIAAGRKNAKEVSNDEQ